ncbi:MAG TPA: winged helix-turn-helix domain-containing protein [Candidatus Angelobacter sp.]|nr:winged helix-turn-helix domain-containing protein [Candidatus Angelobacter sp.]
MALEAHPGKLRVDLDRYELTVDGKRVKLERQPMDLLILFVQKRGELVTREEIIDKLWGKDVFVDVDRGINSAVRKIRTALGDDPANPHCLETVVGKGYRFIGEIEAIGLPEEGKPSLAAAVARPRRIGRGLVASLALSAVVAAAVWAWLRWRQSTVSASAPIRSIAVLPLANLSGDAAQEYFADGMTDELTTDLAKISALRVTSRTSAMRYRDARGPVQQIAQELKVDAIIEGSVARSGNRVRITAQLIDARNDRHLWAESYERDLKDVLDVQNTVALEIAHQVRATLTPAERELLAAHSTVVPEAYDAYLRGRKELGKQRQEALRKGLEYFQQAITLDRLYAPAYAGLADSYSLLVNYSALPPLEGFPKAKAAALKALELDHNLAEAHNALAYVKYHFDLDWAGAEEEYKLSIQLDASNAVTHLRYAELLSNLARHDEAIREVRLAHELAPLSLVIQSNIGRLLYYARRYDEAIPELQQILAADPHRVFSRVHLAKCYEEKRMYPESLAEMEKVRAEFNGQEGIGEAHLYAVLGRVQDARRVLKYQEQPPPDGAQNWQWIAGVYAALGDKDRAFQWLDQAYQNRDFFLTFIKTDPAMDPLRSDPRFAAMLKKIGFPEAKQLANSN